MNLSKFAIERPVTTAMVLLGLAVFGLVSIGYIPLEFLPNVDNPQVSISAYYQSSSPAEIERNITIPLEEALSTVTGIKSIKSSSRENSARITLEYELGVDLDLAMVEIRDRVDRVRPKLPSDLRQLTIFRFSMADIPIMWLSISGSFSEDEMAKRINDVLKRRIETIDGVGQVEVYGIQTKRLDIDLRLSSLRAHNINLYQVYRDLANNNVNLSAGYIIDAGSKYYIRSLGEFDSVEEISEMPIGNGKIKLKDIADVRYDFPDVTTFFRLNSSKAVGMVIYKSSTANLVEVAQAIKEVLDNMDNDPTLKGLQAYAIWDSSTQVTQNLNILKNAGLIGAFFVIIVLFIFLRKLRSLLIVSIAIPLSIVTSFALFYFLNTFFNLGFSINIISLMGLILSVGMLVDNSVVVLESIFRYKEEGLKARLAALKGSQEVLTAVFAATLTTVAVFLTLVFDTRSQIGVWLRDFGISIAVVMFSSLFIALTLVPLASSKLYRKFEPGKDKFNIFFNNLYAKVIKSFLRFRWVIVAVTLIIFFGALNVYQDIQINMSFGGSSRQINMGVEFAQGLGTDQITDAVAAVEKTILDKKEDLEVKAVISRYSRLRGTFLIYLSDDKEAIKTTDEIQSEIAKMLPVFPGVIFKTQGVYGLGGGQISITLRIKGPDQGVLEMVAKDLERKFGYMWGSKNISLNLEAGDERVVVNLNRIRTNQYGLSPMLVGYNILSALSERPVTYYRTEDREVPMILRLNKEDRTGIESLKKMGMPTQDKFIPLETIADFKTVKGAASYEREDKEGVAMISVAGKSFQDLFMYAGVISKQMREYPLPAGYTWGFGEQWLDYFSQEESSNFAQIFAAIMIYIIMVALFQSFVHPFTIMTSIPFAFIGTYVLMALTGTQIDNMTEMGLLVLIGIVVNNAIVMIDYINKLRKNGMERNQAVILGGMHRLRPIIITAMTTILALMPVAAPKLFPALASSTEGQTFQWAPMALVIIGGLTSSTFMTLLVIPCLYTIVDDLSRMVKRVFIRV